MSQTKQMIHELFYPDIGYGDAKDNKLGYLPVSNFITKQ